MEDATTAGEDRRFERRIRQEVPDANLRRLMAGSSSAGRRRATDTSTTATVGGDRTIYVRPAARRLFSTPAPRVSAMFQRLLAWFHRRRYDGRHDFAELLLRRPLASRASLRIPLPLRAFTKHRRLLVNAQAVSFY